MKNFVLLLLFLFSSLVFLNAQDDDFYTNGENTTKKERKEHKSDRWSFGGGLGLYFGSITYIELSPVALYRATPRLYLGPGFSYTFQKYNNYNIQYSSYGPRVLARFSLLQNLDETINLNIGDIILYTEYEYLNLDKFNRRTATWEDGRIWISNVLVGGGIFQPLGQRGGGISLTLLFDVTQNPYSPYENPILRFGFFF